MPGALLAYLGKDWAASAVLGLPAFLLQGTENWMIFVFMAYLLGHITFLFGSFLDRAYDWVRSCTYLGQIRRLANGDNLSFRLMRAMAGFLFRGDADGALIQAVRIKSRALAPLSAADSINTFQWSKARLSKEHPEGLVTVQRFEADSKFFRSFAVVLVVLALTYVSQHRRVSGLICVGTLVPVLWRYVDQRFKTTQQAYWFVITLEGMKDASTPVVAQGQRPDGLTHGGGVVFRKRGVAVEYLLVEASKDRTQCVLPKGHIEPGEDPRETAVREVKEETGQWARVRDWIKDIRFVGDAESPLVRIFLMELVQDAGVWAKVKRALFKLTSENAGKWRPENRQIHWLPLADAKQAAAFEETRTLLDDAEKKSGITLKVAEVYSQ